jgi:hypothetical protein
MTQYTGGCLCGLLRYTATSPKRLNSDAAIKAVSWKLDFGLHQVIPSAVLGGVYKLYNLLEVQEPGLSLFWAHDLAPLPAWTERTKSQS